MRRTRTNSWLWRAMLCCAVAYIAPAGAMPADELYQAVSPSVWIVSASDTDGKPFSQGSGVVIGPETMVTNCHVLAKASHITVRHLTLKLDAKLKWPDVQRDLCTLTVPGLQAAPIKIVPLSQVRVGEAVYSIGAPLGLELTLSDGLVSGLIHDEAGNIVKIQTNAQIQHGSSGGGLFDSSGELIGVTSSGYNNISGSINFAVPAEWINAVPERAQLALANRAAAPVASVPAPVSAPVSAPQVAELPSPPPQRIATVAAPPPIDVPVIQTTRTRRMFAGEALQAGLDSLPGYLTTFGTTHVTITIQQGNVHVFDSGLGQYGDGNISVAAEDFCITNINNGRYKSLNGCFKLFQSGSNLQFRDLTGVAFTFVPKRHVEQTTVVISDANQLNLPTRVQTQVSVNKVAAEQTPSPGTSSVAAAAAVIPSDARRLSGLEVLDQLTRFPDMDVVGQSGQRYHLAFDNGRIRIKDLMRSVTAEGFYKVDSAASALCVSGITTAELSFLNGCYLVGARDRASYELRGISNSTVLAYSTPAQ